MSKPEKWWVIPALVAAIAAAACQAPTAPRTERVTAPSGVASDALADSAATATGGGGAIGSGN